MSLPIGEQIKLMRILRGLSLNQVARDADGELTSAGLSRVENGLRRPALATMEKLAVILDCTFVIDARSTFIVELPADGAKKNNKTKKGVTPQKAR